MSVPIQTDSDAQVTIEIYTGTARESGKEYQCLKLTIGEWSTLIFAKTPFELAYLKSQLGHNE
jgi:hypothetical protein